MGATLEWAQVRAMAADGLSRRGIAARLGINRRTVGRLIEANERRATGARRRSRCSTRSSLSCVSCSGLARDQGATRDRDSPRARLFGSVDLVRRRLQQLRPAKERSAQRTGYRPGQVLQLDWVPTRPKVTAPACIARTATARDPLRQLQQQQLHQAYLAPSRSLRRAA